jgi:hypothetical protein
MAAAVQARTHVFVWTAAALGLLANLDWLAPALAHRELIVPSAGWARRRPAYLIYDFLELLVDRSTPGSSSSGPLLRALVLAGAAAGRCGAGGASRTSARGSGADAGVAARAHLLRGAGAGDRRRPSRIASRCR